MSSLTAARALVAVVLLALAATGAIGAQELDQHGQEHRWLGEVGQVTVIDFAASWCPPCLKSLPRLEAFARLHPEVKVLVVSVDEREAGRDFLVRELELTLPVLWDREHRIAETYAPEAMPATVVLDAGGEVIYRHAGYSEAEWRAFERAVLQRVR